MIIVSEWGAGICKGTYEPSLDKRRKKYKINKVFTLLACPHMTRHYILLDPPKGKLMIFQLQVFIYLIMLLNVFSIHSFTNSTCLIQIPNISPHVWIVHNTFFIALQKKNNNIKQIPYNHDY